jgi:hypothetical protein
VETGRLTLVDQKKRLSVLRKIGTNRAHQMAIIPCLWLDLLKTARSAGELCRHSFIEF